MKKRKTVSLNRNFSGVAREQLKPIDVINQGEAEAIKLKIFLNGYLQRAAAQTVSRCTDKPNPEADITQTNKGMWRRRKKGKKKKKKGLNSMIPAHLRGPGCQKSWESSVKIITRRQGRFSSHWESRTRKRDIKLHVRCSPKFLHWVWPLETVPVSYWPD